MAGFSSDWDTEALIQFCNNIQKLITFLGVVVWYILWQILIMTMTIIDFTQSVILCYRNDTTCCPCCKKMPNSWSFTINVLSRRDACKIPSVWPLWSFFFFLQLENIRITLIDVMDLSIAASWVFLTIVNALIHVCKTMNNNIIIFYNAVIMWL